MSALSKRAAWIAAALLAVSVATSAGAMHHEKTASAGEIAIENGWARATAPNQTVGAAYVTLRNAGAADRLVGGASEVSGSVELHTMSMDNGIMRMRPVKHIEVPAGGTVALEPGGLHIMLVDLKAPLKQGDRIVIELRFENAGSVSAPFTVTAPGGPKTGHNAPMQHKH